MLFLYNKEVGGDTGMDIEVYIALFALIISILSFVISLYYNWKDHERRRKQATIEYFDNLTLQLYEKETVFNEKYNELGVDIAMLDADVELDKVATEVLSAFERLCVGINTGIFDFDILDRMAGSYLINTYTYFCPYIEKKRRDKSQTSAYVEFENAINKIKMKRH